MKRASPGEPLNRLHVSAVQSRGLGDAGADRFAIYDDRAGAAMPLATPVLGSGKVEVFSKDVQEQRAGGDYNGPGLSVDMEGDRYGVHLWDVSRPAVGSIAADLRGALPGSSYLAVGIEQGSCRGGPSETRSLRLAPGLHDLAPGLVAEGLVKRPR
jgi:hypothetical protein